MPKYLLRYEVRHMLSVSLAVMAACVLGYFIDAEQSFWAGVAALLVSQTTRGTPGRQSFHTLFVLVLMVIAAAWMGQYVTNQFHLLVIASTLFVIVGSVVITRQPENMRASLMWLTPVFVFFVALLWPLPKDTVLIDRLVLLITGGAIAIFFLNFVLPVMPYTEFSKGLVPVFDALIGFANELKASVLDEKDHSEKLESRIEVVEFVMQSQQKKYPGWVFEEGFNPQLRAGFRYVVLQIDYLTDAFLSLDYLMRQPVDRSLLSDVAPEIAQVVDKNTQLLIVLRDFFATGRIKHDPKSFINDIEDAKKSVSDVLPGSMDLLDMSEDYMNLSAISKNVMDTREILLDLLASIPADQQTVQA